MKFIERETHPFPFLTNYLHVAVPGVHASTVHNGQMCLNFGLSVNNDFSTFNNLLSIHVNEGLKTKMQMALLK